MLRTVPLAEEYCKKTIRHLAGEPRPRPGSSIHTQRRGQARGKQGAGGGGSM